MSRINDSLSNAPVSDGTELQCWPEDAPVPTPSSKPAAPMTSIERLGGGDRFGQRNGAVDARRETSFLEDKILAAVDALPVGDAVELKGSFEAGIGDLVGAEGSVRVAHEKDGKFTVTFDGKIEEGLEFGPLTGKVGLGVGVVYSFKSAAEAADFIEAATVSGVLGMVPVVGHAAEAATGGAITNHATERLVGYVANNIKEVSVKLEGSADVRSKHFDDLVKLKAGATAGMTVVFNREDSTVRIEAGVDLHREFEMHGGMAIEANGKMGAKIVSTYHVDPVMIDKLAEAGFSEAAIQTALQKLSPTVELKAEVEIESQARLGVGVGVKVKGDLTVPITGNFDEAELEAFFSDSHQPSAIREKFAFADWNFTTETTTPTGKFEVDQEGFEAKVSLSYLSKSETHGKLGGIQDKLKEAEDLARSAKTLEGVRAAHNLN